MAAEYPIEISIHYAGAKQFPSNFVTSVIDAVENAVFEAEMEEMREIQAEFGDLPQVRNALYQLNMHRGEYVRFVTAREGSVILAGVAGLVFWILQNTLGETLKEAYLETKLHKKLKEVLLWGAERTASNVTEKLNQADV